MSVETVEHVIVYEVHFTHSCCNYDVRCHTAETSSESWYYDNWVEAAAAIEQRLTSRQRGCQLDAIVDRVSIPKSEWDEIEEPA